MKDVKRVAEKWIEAFNAHDEKRLRALAAEDALLVAPGIELEGRDEVVGYTMGWLDAFPDGEISSERQIVSGDWIVSQYVFTGTHSETLVGPAGDIPATGRMLTGRIADVSRIEDGLFAESYVYFDQLEVLTQLGVMRERGAQLARA